LTVCEVETISQENNVEENSAENKEGNIDNKAESGRDGSTCLSFQRKVDSTIKIEPKSDTGNRRGMDQND
jgi:hypothetical protein